MVDAPAVSARSSPPVRPQAQLILVGDIDQLPSVGAGAVLADVDRLRGRDRESRLTEIFRQGAGRARSWCPPHAINHGRSFPVLDSTARLTARLTAPARGAATTDFYFFARDDPEAGPRRPSSSSSPSASPRRSGFDATTDIQVLRPRCHRGALGTSELQTGRCKTG